MPDEIFFPVTRRSRGGDVTTMREERMTLPQILEALGPSVAGRGVIFRWADTVDGSSTPALAKVAGSTSITTEIVPAGWKARIYAVTLVGNTAAASGEVIAGRIMVDGTSIMASFGTLRLTDAENIDEAEPTSPLYEIDATAGRVRVTFETGVIGGTSSVVRATMVVYGYMYKP